MKKFMTAGETATTATNLNDLVKDVKIAEELVSETICEEANIDVWRDVEGFEGRYEVSLDGYLRFADKPDKRKVKCSKYGHYLRASLKHKGDPDSLKSLAVHMLVAKAFVPNPVGYTFVKHKNGKLQDNRADNLEWVETNPTKKKKKKKKSKRTAKPLSASPIIEASEGEVLECDVPNKDVSEVEVPHEDFLESGVSGGELWKDVIGYEGLYKVSKNGNVISLRHNKSKYLSKIKAGHMLAYLLTDKYGKVQCKMAHVLVAENFITNPLGYKHVMHIDANPHNNNVDNLRWTERSVRYRKKKSESHKRFKGRHNLMTTQGVEQYYTDGTYINTFKSISEAAEKTRCSWISIKEVLDGKVPSTGGYVWKYSGNVYQTHLNRTIVEKHILKVSIPNWVHKADKFFTFFSKAITNVKNTIKSFFDNFQHTGVMMGRTTLNS